MTAAAWQLHLGASTGWTQYFCERSELAERMGPMSVRGEGAPGSAGRRWSCASGIPLITEERVRGANCRPVDRHRDHVGGRMRPGISAVAARRIGRVPRRSCLAFVQVSAGHRPAVTVPSVSSGGGGVLGQNTFRAFDVCRVHQPTVEAGRPRAGFSADRVSGRHVQQRQLLAVRKPLPVAFGRRRGSAPSSCLVPTGGMGCRLGLRRL